MIPRSSIDEANRHLHQLHSRVSDLETTVHSQTEALEAKDHFHRMQITELSETKEREIAGLSNRLLTSERTVVVLQEEIEKKNQQLVNLQNNVSKLKRLLNFKDDISDLLRTMEDVEDTLGKEDGDTDGLHSNPVNTNGISTAQHLSRKTKKKRPPRVETKTVILSDVEGDTNLGGKEFYL